MTLALPPDQLAGSAVSSFAARARQTLRFDGLWWRQVAALGCICGPEWVRRYLPTPTAAMIFLLVRQNRRGAIANMARIVGNTRRTEAAVGALRMYAEFARCMTETMEYYGPSPQPIQVDLPEPDGVVEALREGRGAVVVTGHFGNWDIAAKSLREHGRPINMVMAREKNATTNHYVHAVREQAGVQVIYSDTSVFSSLNMIRALRRNEIVAIQLDRSPGAGGARLVPFFGAPALFPSGPFLLARAAGAPLIPVFIPRLGTRHYAVRIGDRFRVPQGTQALDRVMAEVVHAFEDTVRAFPTQWFQFAPFWPGGVAARRDHSAEAPDPMPLRTIAPQRRTTGDEQHQLDQQGKRRRRASLSAE